MNFTEKISGTFRASHVTSKRIVLALAIAAAADILQILFLPFAWTFVDSAVDVVAMFLIMRLIGFHWLLLPTFAIEFIPFVDALPTWTACTVAVIVLRKREARNLPLPSISNKPTIEI
jgi:hypothetical protein